MSASAGKLTRQSKTERCVFSPKLAMRAALGSCKGTAPAGARGSGLPKTLDPEPMAAIAGSTKLADDAGGPADADGNAGGCAAQFACEMDMIAGS